MILMRANPLQEPLEGAWKSRLFGPKFKHNIVGGKTLFERKKKEQLKPSYTARGKKHGNPVRRGKEQWKPCYNSRGKERWKLGSNADSILFFLPEKENSKIFVVENLETLFYIFSILEQ